MHMRGSRLCIKYLTNVMAQVGSVSYDRQPIADHAQNLASTIKTNLQKSLEAIGVVRLAPLLWCWQSYWHCGFFTDELLLILFLSNCR